MFVLTNAVFVKFFIFFRSRLLYEVYWRKNVFTLEKCDLIANNARIRYNSSSLLMQQRFLYVHIFLKTHMQPFSK